MDIKVRRKMLLDRKDADGFLLHRYAEWEKDHLSRGVGELGEKNKE